jgi:hypothetical protein
MHATNMHKAPFSLLEFPLHLELVLHSTMAFNSSRAISGQKFKQNLQPSQARCPSSDRRWSAIPNFPSLSHLRTFILEIFLEKIVLWWYEQAISHDLQPTHFSVLTISGKNPPPGIINAIQLRKDPGLFCLLLNFALSAL